MNKTQMNNMVKKGLFGFFIFGLFACSTTKNLPKGEVLYTGIEDITITDPEFGKLIDTHSFAIGIVDV